MRDHEATRAARYDLVLLGNDAADTGDFQVGIRLAYELGLPGRQRRLDVSRSPTASSSRARATGPDGPGDLPVPLPAVVTVLEGGVEPRYPTRARAGWRPRRSRSRSAAPAPSRSGSSRVQLAAASADAEQRRRSSARVPRPPPAVVDLFEKLGVLAR